MPGALAAGEPDEPAQHGRLADPVLRSADDEQGGDLAASACVPLRQPRSQGVGIGGAGVGVPSASSASSISSRVIPSR